MCFLSVIVDHSLHPGLSSCLRQEGSVTGLSQVVQCQSGPSVSGSLPPQQRHTARCHCILKLSCPSLFLFVQKNVTFCFPASASSLELIRHLGRKPRCRLIISQLDGFSMSRPLLQEVQYTVASKYTLPH